MMNRDRDSCSVREFKYLDSASSKPKVKVPE